MVLPLQTVQGDPRDRAIRKVSQIARERSVIEIVVGLPRNMDGSEGDAARKARHFAEGLASRLPEVRICLVDERLTSMQAQGRLREVGIDTRRSRNVIDQLAAQIILEQALQRELLQDNPPGETIEGGEGSRRKTGE